MIKSSLLRLKQTCRRRVPFAAASNLLFEPPKSQRRCRLAARWAASFVEGLRFPIAMRRRIGSNCVEKFIGFMTNNVHVCYGFSVFWRFPAIGVVTRTRDAAIAFAIACSIVRQTPHS